MILYESIKKLKEAENNTKTFNGYLYHCSNSPIEQFDTNHFEEDSLGGVSRGFGIYFCATEEAAKSYQSKRKPYILKCKVECDNVIDYNEYKRLINQSEQENIGNNTFHAWHPETIRETMLNNNVDALIDSYDGQDILEMIVYNLDCIKSVELINQLNESEVDINKIIEDLLKENKITHRTKASNISDDKFDNLVGQLKSKIPNKSEKELSNELSKYLFGHLDESEEPKLTADLYQYTKNSYGKAFFDFNPSDFDFNDYSKVGSIEYTPTGDTNQDLDQIFRLGNTEQSVRDANPEMHSISVSDIIKLDDKYYYVQAFGFEDITDKITDEPSQNVIIKVKDKNGREGYLSGDEDSLKFWIVDEPSQAQIFSNTRQDIKAAEYRARLNDLEVTAVIPD